MSGGADRRERGRKLPIAGEPEGGTEPGVTNGEGAGTAAAEAGDRAEAEAKAPAAPAEADASTAATTPAELTVKDVPSWRLILTLALAGAIAGLAIVLVFGWAAPRIEAHRAAALRAAIQEVLGGPERYETLFVLDGALTAALPANVDSAGLDRVYAGYARDGSRMGFAVAGEQPGYQDIVGLIFGYDPDSDELLGMKVLESKETPGLGDKIEKDSAFVASFRGVVPLIEGVKAGEGTDGEHEVDMITGATISSRTVIEIINKRMESIGPMIQAFAAESAVAAESGRTEREPAGDAAEAGG